MLRHVIEFFAVLIIFIIENIICSYAGKFISSPNNMELFIGFMFLFGALVILFGTISYFYVFYVKDLLKQ